MPKPIGNARDRLRAQAAAVQRNKQEQTTPKMEQMSTARDRLRQQAARVEYERQLPGAIKQAQETYIKTNTGSREQEDRAKSPIQEPVAVRPSVSVTQSSNRRFQTVSERAADKPESTNPRARGNNAGDTSSRLGKGIQSIGMNIPATFEYLGESGKQIRENAIDYQQNSGLKDQAAAALNAIKLARTLYGEGSEQHLQAQADYDALREEIMAYQNAPDKVVDPNSRASHLMGQVQQLQEEALEGTSGAGRFLGEAALSIGNNLAMLPLNAIVPGASLAMMGAQAAAGKAYELGQRGVSAGEALGRGLVSGGIEALTEKIPLDNLVDIIKTGGKVGLMNILKQAATEAGEEGVAYLLNLGADKVAGDPEAEFVWNDFWKSVGMGALSGGIMGGGATAINRANAAAVGKAYQDVAPELVAEGLQMKQDTDAYRTAAEMQRKLDAGKTLSNVDVGRVVQDNETAMAPLRQAAMEMAEEQVEREAQAAMPKRTVVQPIAMKPRTAYTETRQNTEGGVNGGEEVHLRESGQRDDRAYPGGEVPRMEESAGRDQSRQDSRLPAKDAGAAVLRVGKEVSTASLGIGNGAAIDRVRVVTGGDTEATAKAKAIAKERGLRLTLFTGGNLTINGEECRAYITGDRAFVRADHSDFDADQLMRHEAGHDQIAKGEIDIEAATENIRKRLGGRNNVQRAAQTYASAFAGADMTVEEAIEEIICDSLGDMNVFSDTAFETAFGEVLEIAKAAAGESRAESKTGPPAEGKASRETNREAISKMDKNYFDAVNRGDMETAQRMVDEAAKAAGYTLKVYHGTPKTNAEVNPNWADAVLGIHSILLPEAQPLVPGSKEFYAFDNLMRYRFGKLKPDVRAKVPKNMLRVLRQGPMRNFTSFSMSHAGESTKTADSKDGFFVTEDASFAASFMKTYEYDMFLDETRETSIGDGSLYELYLRPDETTEYRKTYFGGRSSPKKRVVEIVVKNPEQLKSADPVTYDDTGNVIPLSERFDSSKEDIRFSRETNREDVLKAVEKLLEEADAKLAEQELADQMYYGRKAEVQKRNAQEKLERLREQKNERIAQVKAEGRETVKVARVEERVKADAKLAEQELADQMYYGRKAEVQKRNAQEKLERLREQKNERIAQVKAEGREAVKVARIEERVERDERIAQIEEAHKAELKDTVTAERMAAGREMAAVKQRYKERVEQSRESRSATKRRAQILRHVNKVQQLLLRPTDKNHVPESLRKATASVLSAINTESGFEVMLGKDNKRRRVAEGTAGAEATKRTQAFASLKKACEEIMKNAEDSIILDPDLLGDSANGIPGLLDQLADLNNKRIADMNNDELDIVWRVLRSIEHSISSAGKVLSAAKYEQTAEWADAFVADTASKRSKKGNRLEAMRLDLENPYTFFGHYGEAGKAVFRMLRDAQDEQQLMVENIRGMVQTFVDAKTVESLEKETHDFTTEACDKLTLNTAQIMEIYLLMKREQAHDHLMKGGIVQPEVKSRKINRGTDAIKLSYNDLTAITKVLTDKQREIANNLQMLTTTTLADYGNEASMKVYGYKKFTGTDYWPIKSAGEGIHTNVEKGGNNTRSIKNIGMAKAVMPKASNALDINSVFSTFASHTADMVDYAAWLCPMEDANRLFNFQFRDEDGNKTGRTMKGLLDRFGGKDAQKYWSGLMEDIQNGIKAQSDTAILQPVNKMIGNVRGASVGANLRVIVQQPTAILRASAVLTPEAMFRGMFIGGGWKTALEHSPVAMRKNMGGFDISSPMQMNEVLFDNKTKLQRVNEFFMAGAGKADAVTWGRIWNACESEVAWNNKNLKPGTDEFYEKVNELFTEVIDQSQVVDGVLQRSRAMRSSNTFVQQATAFMGEPTMTLNMMLRAYDNFASETDGKKRTAARKAFGKTAMALVLTNAINALAQSLVDALRDDSDEEYTAKVLNAFTGIADEETAWEKATAAVLSGNFGSSLNPVEYVPFAKDILSVLQGYNVTRADADVVGDIISSVKTFNDSISGDGKRSIAYATKNLAQQVSKVFGVSAANLLRDAWGIARTIAQETGNIELQYEMEKAIYKLNNDGNTSRFTKLLYKAYNADEEAYNHIYADMESAGVDMEKVRKQMEKLLKEEQGVTNVNDLDSRYLNPTLQKTYDSAMQTVRGNKLWDKATEEQQDKVEDILYELTVGSASGKKMQEKIDGGKAAGIDTADFLLYKLALEMADANGNGDITQEEFKSADFELSREQLSFMWEEDRGWSPSTNPYD